MDKFSTPWLDEKRGYLSDWITQLWVKSSHLKINPLQEPWLDGPKGNPKSIGESFFNEYAMRNNLEVDPGSNDSGLLDEFSQLNSQYFDVTKVHPEIAEFYEHTNRYELDVWSDWSTLVKPFGWLLTKIFSKRIQQLNLPVSSLDLSHGVSSEIVGLRNKNNKMLEYTGWIRKGLKTGDVIYAGAYTTSSPVNLGFKCVKVVFPLPNGNATVILRPQALDDGSLKLKSSGNGFGDAGFYLLVYSSDDKAHVRYLKSFKETIHVYLNEEKELRTDHNFNLFGYTFLRLHYRIRKKDLTRTGS